MRVPFPIRTCSLLFAFAAFAMLAGSPARADVNPLWDHYKVYIANPHLPGGMPVALRDQFTNSTHIVEFLEFFMNPVDKLDLTTGERSPIHDPFLHYTWWRITPDPFEATISVVNQFGGQSLRTHHGEYLLNPALKENITPPLPMRNHYKCYRCDGPPVDRPVVLTDQFDIWQTVALFPRFFCNPTDKYFEGAIHPIEDPLLHYVCYDINPIDPNQFARPFRDQFAQGTLVFNPGLMLCVPSDKLGVVTAQQSTWGKLKLLYR